MRVALVHDWLTGMRGGEKCLEVFCELFPEADVFTLLHIPGSVSPTIERHRISTSLLQRLPGSARHYRWYLPLMPTAIEAFDLSAYDLVISSSHCVAKGVIPRPDALHVAYMHTPMRYAWDLWPQYFPPTGLVSRCLIPPVLNYLRTWDVAASQRVDVFVANSQFVAQRIARYYRRRATVLHPPVDTAWFTPGTQREAYYLMVTALVPYKGVEMAIAAFNALQRPLKIIGSGPLAASLKALAGPSITFLGWRSNEELRQYYAACRALIFPAQEDFGIVPLEANAAGRPVIALGLGGALETVIPLAAAATTAPTGILFTPRSAEALADAVRVFEAQEARFCPQALRQHAQQFDRQHFKTRFAHLIARLLDRHRARQHRHSPAAPQMIQGSERPARLP